MDKAPLLLGTLLAGCTVLDIVPPPESQHASATAARTAIDAISQFSPEYACEDIQHAIEMQALRFVPEEDLQELVESGANQVDFADGETTVSLVVQDIGAGIHAIIISFMATTEPQPEQFIGTLNISCND